VAELLRVLVCGGSGALGRVVCRTLAEQGCRLAFTYHHGSAVAAELLGQLPAAHALKLDLAVTANIARVVDEAAAVCGGLDAFVQCAALGVSPGDPVPAGAHQRMGDVGDAGWDAMMAVNVKGPFFACREVARHLRQAGGGNILLVGSVDGVKPVPAPVHYSASKSALVGMTHAMTKELGRDNIRVNLVAPGILEAGLSRTLPQHLRDDYVKHCGLRRVGRLEEAAHLVAWLARHNTYVAGQTIVVDGAL
jgi:NAD(P)-dependent dehydrogenase (short-subunit alcohol dehydrogenase family)